MADTFQGKPCKRGHTGIRYVKNHGCVDCLRETTRAWQQRNRVKARASSKKWMAKNGRALKFQSRYGISEEDYNRMLSQQDGLCAVCHQPPTSKGIGSKLHVDHDHKTGKVRGLLCHFCNHGLGNFKDNAEALESAAAYVRNGHGR